MVSSLENRWSATHTRTHAHVYTLDTHIYKFLMAASSACWEKLTFSTSHTSINTQWDKETINTCSHTFYTHTSTFTHTHAHADLLSM